MCVQLTQSPIFRIDRNLTDAGQRSLFKKAKILPRGADGLKRLPIVLEIIKFTAVANSEFYDTF